MKNLSARNMLLHSTGVTWDEKSLLRRYSFLRRIQSGVELRLLYYPYWLLELRGHAHWNSSARAPWLCFSWRMPFPANAFR